MCVECKLKENVCMYDRGGQCLGPVTRAGCGAICPTYGDGCEGCRGLIPDPNSEAMSDVLVKHGLTVDDMLARLVDVRDVSADGVGGEEVTVARNRQTSCVKRQCVERCACPINTSDVSRLTHDTSWAEGDKYG